MFGVKVDSMTSEEMFIDEVQWCIVCTYVHTAMQQCYMCCRVRDFVEGAA